MGYAHFPFLDVAAILRLPILGKVVHPSVLPNKVNFNYIDVGGVYSTFIVKNAKIEVEVSDIEHTTFLMYFFRKFFYGTASVDRVQYFVYLMLSNTVY